MRLPLVDELAAQARSHEESGFHKTAAEAWDVAADAAEETGHHVSARLLRAAARRNRAYLWLEAHGHDVPYGADLRYAVQPLTATRGRERLTFRVYPRSGPSFTLVADHRGRWRIRGSRT